MFVRSTWWCVDKCWLLIGGGGVGDVTTQAEINRSYTKHRKIASSFRDTQLFEIFELGINLLKKAHEMIKTVDYSDADQVSHVVYLLTYSWRWNHVTEAVKRSGLCRGAQ